MFEYGLQATMAGWHVFLSRRQKVQVVLNLSGNLVALHVSHPGGGQFKRDTDDEIAVMSKDSGISAAGQPDPAVHEQAGDDRQHGEHDERHRHAAR